MGFITVYNNIYNESIQDIQFNGESLVVVMKWKSFEVSVKYLASSV